MQNEKWTKADVVDAVYVEMGLNKSHIRTVYDLIFAGIKGALIAGKTVELRGVGTFETSIRSAREKAHNPRTGEPIFVHRHRTVKFRPGRELRLAVWEIPGEDQSATEPEA